MIAVILLLDVEGIAKLASAFQLLIFGLINVSVIVMRERPHRELRAGLPEPRSTPGCRSPASWPRWCSSGQLGALAHRDVAGQSSPSAWRGTCSTSRPTRRVVREGAIYHLFARLGERRFEGLDAELRTILKDKGLSDETPFEQPGHERAGHRPRRRRGRSRTSSRWPPSSWPSRRGSRPTGSPRACWRARGTGATPGLARGRARPHVRLCRGVRARARARPHAPAARGPGRHRRRPGAGRGPAGPRRAGAGEPAGAARPPPPHVGGARAPDRRRPRSWTTGWPPRPSRTSRRS